MSAEPSRRAAYLWPTVKWLLFALVLWFVGRQARDMWRHLDDTPLAIHWRWFALSAVLSIVAWLPCLAVWRSLMRSFGCDIPWFAALYAYYIGHLGKYVPGKATVIVIRTALLNRFGLRPAVGAFTVTIEALMYMAAGLTVAAALVPYAAADFPQLPWLTTVANSPFLRICVPLAIGILGLTTLALASHQFIVIATRMAAKKGIPADAFPPLPRRVLVISFLVFLAAWWIQGLALGAAIAAVSPEHAVLQDWPRWTGAAALALVGGFVVLFAPGGLGVREALLLALLSQLEPRAAVLVTVLWRGATLVGELVTTGVLWGLRPAFEKSHPVTPAG